MSTGLNKKRGLPNKVSDDAELSAKNQTFIKLGVDSMAKGIGRKATDDELMEYLLKDMNVEPLDIEEAFLKYIKADDPMT